MDIPVNCDRFALHQSLCGAPAEADKLRIAKYWIQILQQPGLGFWIWKQFNINFIQRNTFFVDINYKFIYHLDIQIHSRYPHHQAFLQSSSLLLLDPSPPAGLKKKKNPLKTDCTLVNVSIIQWSEQRKYWDIPWRRYWRHWQQERASQPLVSL